ncbi:hypothetical protein DB30_00068 [Enhygromyxa salina]|uniref:DUF3050 domain-containing protein n=1 Tax=Enhygromyxa salina TaxID=215803 RepID=A0A0C1ZPJ0_9BACT|nr:DUF3050 domain-containing protein [Enhygromyxa salina]KIG19559.1 hypothetical protein DB30_00068 [Enhygromyxa salina]
MKLPLGKIKAKTEQLYAHPLLSGDVINSIDALHVFMEHHVFAVWDFMSLAKGLQHHVCPSTTCWVPTRWIRSGAARLINEIVLSEESDIDMDGESSISHHDLYCQAMLEVGADPTSLEDFVNCVMTDGVRYALENMNVPAPSLRFMNRTFEFIDTGEPHIVAAAFCFGREKVIPQMFQHIADRLELSEVVAPKFHYYLQRHIEVDGEHHGPAAITLVETLCDHDPVHIHEAEQAAIEALEARIRLWNEVEQAIRNELPALRHN